MKLLEFTSNGIYCSKADVYLDPWRGVEKAIITHGHSDHARWGSKSYITQIDNVPILKHRLGDISASQIKVEYKGEVWVFTGDFKTQEDKISTPYEPIKCNTFITECTFGLPVYKWEKPKIVHEQINNWWAENKSNGVTSLLMGYSLGKIQRLLKNLDPEIGKIFTHGATEKMTEVLRTKIDFPNTTLITRDTSRKEIEGNLVLAPPAVLGSAWSKKFGITSTGYASGWMAIRGARRRRGVDKSFVLSDHADWDGLLSAIYSTGCENVITTHGYTDIFAKYLNEQGLNALSQKTEYEQETPETENLK